MRGIVSLRKRTFEVLELAPEEDDASRLFDIAISILICANILAVVLESVPSLFEAYHPYFYGFEVVSVAVFTAEYGLRVWSSVSVPRYSHPVLGRLRFSVTPLALIDLLAIAPFYLPMVMTLDLRFARALRLFRLLRVLKLTRYSESMRALGRVFRDKREELTLTLAVGVMLLLFASSGMYFIESDVQPGAFNSIPAAMWWGVATLTTVGYGDVYPVTALGKFFGVLIAVFGVGIFALPAGILASGLTQNAGLEDGAEASKPDTCPHCGVRLLSGNEPRPGPSPQEDTDLVP